MESILTESNVVEDAKGIPAAVTLRKSVRDAVNDKQEAGEVRGRVKDQLVEVELDRRAGVLATALETRETLAKDFNKIKPDQVSCDEHSNVVSSFYSKTKAAELKKAREKLNKCDAAITKCIENADYEALKKWQKGGDSSDKD